MHPEKPISAEVGPPLLGGRLTSFYRNCPAPRDQRHLWNARFTFAVVRLQVLLLFGLSLAAWFQNARQLALLYLTWVALAILPWKALSRGHALWAGAIWSIICWITSLTAVLLLGGQERDTFYTFLIIHMVAILVLGTRYTPALIALAAASTSVLAGAEVSGFVPQARIPPLSPEFITLLSISNVLLAGVVVWLMIDGIAEMVATADTRRQALAERNRILEETRHGLEQAVESRTKSLQASNRSLQKEVDERRQTEVQLATTLEAAKAAARTKSAFLANMSHEIRTPLNGVLGLADVLLSGKVPVAEQKFLVRALQSSGRTLQRILDDILDLSKLEAGRVAVEHRAFDLHELVEDVLDSFARDALHRKLELVADLEKAPKHVRSDPTRLRQILVNLVGNSLKFTKLGSITVAIETEDEFDHLRFSIRDTGIGIPIDQQENLFEAFTQSDTSTTREFGGTGLGLAICRRLTQLLGGRLWMESEEGRGSTFSFSADAEILDRTFPKPQTQLTEAASSPGEAPIQGHPKAPHKTPGTALVLEAWSGNRDITVCLLESWDYQVEVGEAPWDGLLDEPALEVLVMDLGQAESLSPDRRSDLLDHAHIRLLSASVADSRAYDRCTALGFDRVLARPVTPARLMGALTEMVTSSEEKSSLESESEPLAPMAPLSVLLAEDNEINRLVALNILKVLGYQVAVARNGLEVLRALERQRFDVVLMDLMMPRLDGLQTTRRIRAELPTDQQPRIVAVTASVLPEQQQLCREAGMDDFLGKPIKLETTREILLRCYQALQPNQTPGILGSSSLPNSKRETTSDSL